MTFTLHSSLPRVLIPEVEPHKYGTERNAGNKTRHNKLLQSLARDPHIAAATSQLGPRPISWKDSYCHPLRQGALKERLFSSVVLFLFETTPGSHVNDSVDHWPRPDFSCRRRHASPVLWKQRLRSCSFWSASDSARCVPALLCLLCLVAPNKSTLLRSPGFVAGSGRSIALIFRKGHAATHRICFWTHTHSHTQKRHGLLFQVWN